MNLRESGVKRQFADSILDEESHWYFGFPSVYTLSWVSHGYLHNLNCEVWSHRKKTTKNLVTMMSGLLSIDNQHIKERIVTRSLTTSSPVGLSVRGTNRLKSRYIIETYWGILFISIYEWEYTISLTPYCWNSVSVCYKTVQYPRWFHGTDIVHILIST